MAQLPGGFKPQDYDDMRNFDAVPNAWYHLAVEDSSIELTKKAKENKDPSLGQMLKLKIKILDGKYKGKYVFEQLNIINPNPETVKIANEALATLCRAVGFANGLPDGDTAHLHGKPFDGHVIVEKGKDGYNDKNKMSNYKPYGTQNVDTAGGSTSSESTAAKMDEPKSSGKKSTW